MIRLDKLSIKAGSFQLNNLSLEIPTGHYGVLMGSTGSGKTSILEAVAGLRPTTAGGIWLDGRNVVDLPPGERGIGYVPQDGALFRTMTVREHLAFALKLRGEKKSVIATRVAELAASFQIAHLLDRRPLGLSGGEIQRVALGRALSFGARFLLLDEPLSAVDEATRDSLIGLLNNIRHTREVTVLHVTHSSAEAACLGDIVHKIIDGNMMSGRSESR